MQRSKRQDKPTERVKRPRGSKGKEETFSRQAITSGLSEGKLSFSNKLDYIRIIIRLHYITGSSVNYA